MNLAEIETFLTIVNTKSITRTADLLFLSQPTVSHRLTSLENELGFPLVIRQKGHKQVELTAKGTDFIILAERWMSLWKETMELQRNQDSLLLTIGCTDSLNVAVFAPLYDRILNEQTKLDLNIESHHSSELYGLLGEHSIDIGFVYHKLHYKNIITEKIFEEKLRTLPLTNKNARTFTRFVLGSAVDGGLDKQGRVLISSALRTFAGLEKEVVLVGVLDRVEIWDKAKWDDNNAVVEEDMDDIASQMEELGLGI